MNRRKSISWKVIAVTLAVMVLFSTVAYDLQREQGYVYANLINQPLMKQLSFIVLKVRSQKMDLPLIKGISLDQKDKLQIDFYFDRMNRKNKLKTEEVKRNIRYFLGFLAMPEEKLWVNLSPYEKERVVDRDLGKLDIGKDFLVMDYLLKQLVAKLTSPKTKEGRKYWEKVYAAAEKIAGTRRIPINNFYPRKADFTKCVINVFNKVWVIPDVAEVDECISAAFVKEARLKVMMEADYFAQSKMTNDQFPISKQLPITNFQNAKQDNISPVGACHGWPVTKANQNKLINQINNQAKEIFKRELLPIIENQVNYGETFAVLRQLYYALILATYCKDKWNESKEYQGYIDSAKAQAIAYLEKEAAKIKDNVYQGYLESFRQGDRVVEGKRSYVSGGVLGMGVKQVLKVKENTSSADFNSFRFNFGRGEKIRVALQRRPNNKRDLIDNKQNVIYEKQMRDAQSRYYRDEQRDNLFLGKNKLNREIFQQGIKALRQVLMGFGVYAIVLVMLIFPMYGCDREQGQGTKIKSENAPIERVDKIHKESLAKEDSLMGIDNEQEEILKQLEDRDASNRVKGLEKVLGLLEKEQIVLSEKLLEKLIGLLENKDMDIRYNALRILATGLEKDKITYSDEYVEKLIGLLGNIEWKVREFTLEMLSSLLEKNRIRDIDKFVGKLISLLGDENYGIREGALKILSVGLEKDKIRYSDEIVEKLLWLFGDQDENVSVRDNASQILSKGLEKDKIGDVDEFVERLIKLLCDKDYRVREHALIVLSAGLDENKIKYNDDIVGKIINLLGDEDSQIKSYALYTLSSALKNDKISDINNFVEKVVELLEGQSQHVIEAAIRVLPLALGRGKLGYSEKHVEIFMRLLVHESIYVRLAVLETLSSELEKGKIFWSKELLESLILVLDDNNVGIREISAKILRDRITPESFRIIKKILFDYTLDKKVYKAIFLSEVMFQHRDWVLQEDVRKMFNFILFRDVFKNLEEIIIEHNGFLKEEISKLVKAGDKEEIFKVANFNLFLYLLSLKQEYVSLDEKEEYLKCLRRSVDTLSLDKRLMVLLGLGSVLKQLSQEEIGELKVRVHDLVERIEGVSKNKEFPDYAAIFDKNTNPNQEFNIMLYANLHPQLYADRFKKEGYEEKDSKTGGVKIYSKEVNGKKVSIRLDFVTNPGGLNNKNMLKYINNHKCHLIAYAGHTSMGKPFMHSFKKTPLEAFRKKIICLFSCFSARAFFREFFKRSPGVDLIGTKTYAWDSNDSVALLAIIDGVTSGKSWEEIKKNADEKIKKIAELKEYKELEDLFFPHEDASAYFYQDMVRVSTSKIKYFHYNVDRKIELLNNLSFEFEMGFVDIDQISHEKVKAAVETDVRFILERNPYLVDVARKLKGVGFNIFEEDSQQVCTYNQWTGQVSVNVGYRNSSKEAIAMMLIYQLNLEIAKSKNGRKITVWDKIRGLQLVASYLYSQRELRAVVPDFLRKFGYDPDKIRYSDIIKIFYSSIDESKKREIIEKMLKDIDSNISLPETKDLKGMGVFGEELGQIRENRSVFEGVEMQERETQYAYRQLEKLGEEGERARSKVFSSGGVLDFLPMYLRKVFSNLSNLPQLVNPGGIDFRKKGLIKRKNISNMVQEEINQRIKCDYSFSFQILSRSQL